MIVSLNILTIIITTTQLFVVYLQMALKGNWLFVRKWYKLGTNVRDIIYSVCAGAGLFMYLTILHADKHTLVLLT